MFRVIGLVIFGFVVSCQSPVDSEHSAETLAQIQTPLLLNISPAEAQKRIAEGNVAVIDVRTAGEVAEGMIAGATHADILTPSDFEKSLSSLDPSKPIIVYCKVGGRSKKAADLLIDRGFFQVYNISGGMDAWKAAELPIEKI